MSNAFSRSRRQRAALAAVLDAAYAFQRADRAADAAWIADQETADTTAFNRAMEERDDRIRELHDALDAYAPYRDPGAKEQP